jgi:DNA-binding transcriptional MerR regulator
VPKIDTKHLTKLYYSIGEVADLFEVNTSLIRFWEKEFPAIKPKKNNKGNRLFTVKDIATIDRIYTLVKDEGHTLDGARKALKEKTTVSGNSPLETTPTEADYQEVINRLEALKEQLVGLKG